MFFTKVGKYAVYVSLRFITENYANLIVHTF